MLRTVVAILLLSCCVARGADRPNILFIFTDDHAVQALGAYNGRLADVV